MSQSLIDEFHKEQAEVFASYLSSIKGIESRMKQALVELAEKDCEMTRQVDTAKALNIDLNKQKEDYSLKLDELRSSKSLLEAERKQLVIDSKSLKDRNSKLDDKQKAQANEHTRLTELSNNLKKREQTLEMDERRNKYFEHKLNLVAGDSKIKAELEKLEGAK